MAGGSIALSAATWIASIQKEEMMSHWFSHWIQNQKQTRRFHPFWILLAVVVTIIVAGIIWIPAALVTRAEQDDRPPAANSRGKTAVPAEKIPATRALPQTGPKTPRVDFSHPAIDGLAAECGRYSRNGSKQT